MAAPFSGFASVSIAWWWDSVVDLHNLWTLLRSLADFMRDEDLSLLVPATATVAPPCATALTLQNNHRALLWIHSDAHNSTASSLAFMAAAKSNANTAAADWNYLPEPLTNVRVTLHGLADG